MVHCEMYCLNFIICHFLQICVRVCVCGPCICDGKKYSVKCGKVRVISHVYFRITKLMFENRLQNFIDF